MIKLNSKIFNKIILYFVCLTIIYFLNKTKINNMFRNFFFKKENIEIEKKINTEIQIPAETDFHSENLNSVEAEKLYKYLKTLISNESSLSMDIDYSKKLRLDSSNEEILIKFLNQKLNNSVNEMKIKNINIIDKVFFLKNKISLDILPFQIVGKYYFRENFIGNVKIQLEMNFKFDKSNSIFISQTIFNNLLGFFGITRVILTGHKFVNPKKEILPSKIKQLELNNENSKPFYFDYDKDNQKENILDTINSLIPEDIEITEYEKTSEYPISTQKVAI